MSYTFLLEQGEESWAESFSDIPQSVLSRLNLTPEKSSCKDNGMESCQNSQSGMMSKPLMENHGADLSMLFVGDSHARTSAPQEKGQESQAKDRGFGQSSRESLAKYDPDSRSWKTHQCSLLGGLTEFSETWPRWGMMRNGELFQEQTPYGLMKIRALITSETGFGFERVPTVTKTDSTERAYQYDQGDHSKPRLTLVGIARIPTPTKCAAKGSSPNSLLRKDGRSRANDRLDHRIMAESVMRIGSPTKTMSERSEKFAKGRNPTPAEFVKRVPTPQKSDADKWSNQSLQDRLEKGQQVRLNTAISPGGGAGGQLNPPWVEWLMGWPIGWTGLQPLEMDKFQQWRDSHGKIYQEK